MAKWICKCGERLSTHTEINSGYEAYEYVNEKELREYLENCNDAENLRYFEFESDVTQNIFYQCPKCGRLWFDTSDITLTNNTVIKSLISSSNTISFKPEPVFLDDNDDVINEIKRIADETNSNFELKYINKMYHLTIDNQKISDESLSGILQIITYGKKY